MKVDSAKQNLANTFVNGFVNVGFASDTLLLGDESSLYCQYHNVFLMSHIYYVNFNRKRMDI